MVFYFPDILKSLSQYLRHRRPSAAFTCWYWSAQKHVWLDSYNLGISYFPQIIQVFILLQVKIKRTFYWKLVFYSLRWDQVPLSQDLGVLLVYACHFFKIYKKSGLFIYLSIYLFIYVLDIFFIYISNVIQFPDFPFENSLSHSNFPCSPTYPLLLPCLGIPLHWGIEPSQDQGPLLPLMSNKAIFCYICIMLYFKSCWVFFSLLLCNVNFHRAESMI